MPYKDPADKKKHNAEYLARMKKKLKFRVKQRARQKKWLKNNPIKHEAALERARNYKQKIGYSKLNKRYRGKRFKKRRELRYLLESVEVWKTVSRLASEARIKKYLFEQFGRARIKGYRKTIYQIRLNNAKWEYQLIVYERAAWYIWYDRR